MHKHEGAMRRGPCRAQPIPAQARRGEAHGLSRPKLRHTSIGDVLPLVDAAVRRPHCAHQMSDALDTTDPTDQSVVAHGPDMMLREAKASRSARAG